MSDAIGGEKLYKLELSARGSVNAIAKVEDAIREHLMPLPGVSIDRWSEGRERKAGKEKKG